MDFIFTPIPYFLTGETKYNIRKKDKQRINLTFFFFSHTCFPKFRISEIKGTTPTIFQVATMYSMSINERNTREI